MSRHGDPDDDVLVVLAGGRSSRFQGDKALAEFAAPDAGERTGSESLTGRVLRQLAPLASRRAVVRAAPLGGLPEGVATIADPRPGDGPLQALAAAFAALPARRWFVAPCDAPLLDPEIYYELARSLASTSARGGGKPPSAVAAWNDGRCEALVSIWTPTAAAPLAAWLAAEPRLPVHVALARLGAARCDFADARPFLNVNTRADLVLAGEALR